MKSEVLRFLVSGTNLRLTTFSVNSALHANFLERRGQTVIFTLMSENEPEIIALAKSCEVTLERIDGAGESETYTMIHQADHPGWAARMKTK